MSKMVCKYVPTYIKSPFSCWTSGVHGHHNQHTLTIFTVFSPVAILAPHSWDVSTLKWCWETHPFKWDETSHGEIKTEKKNRMGCNSPECFPLMSPLLLLLLFFFFLPGRVALRKNTGTQCSLYLNKKGKHFSLEFGLQRLIGSLHITNRERWALCWFVPWIKSLQAEMFFVFFLPTSLFLPEPLWSFLDEKVPDFWEHFLG